MKIAIVMGNDRVISCEAVVVDDAAMSDDRWVPGVRVVGDAPSVAMEAAEYAMNEGVELAAGWFPDSNLPCEPDFDVVGCGIPSLGSSENDEISAGDESDIKAFVVTEASRVELEATRLIRGKLATGSQVRMIDGRVFSAGRDGALKIDDSHRHIQIGQPEYSDLDSLCMAEETDFHVSFGASAVGLQNVPVNTPDGKTPMDISGADVDGSQSRSEAEKIAAQKGEFGFANLTADRPIIGRVMGVTAQHVVLSLGRSATIFEKADLSRVPAKDEDVSIAVKGGRALVTDQLTKSVDRDR